MPNPEAVTPTPHVISAISAEPPLSSRTEAVAQEIRDTQQTGAETQAETRQPGRHESRHDNDTLPLWTVMVWVAIPVVIVFAILIYRARRQREQHRLILKLAELGQPIPPALFSPPSRGPSLNSALMLIAVGLGTCGAMLLDGSRGEAAVGLIPLFIGIARLIAWKVEGQGRRGG